MPKRSLYLINPEPSIPNYFTYEAYQSWGLGKYTSIADLSTVTVATLAAKDLDVTICDEQVEEVDLDCDADYIGITGKSSQFRRMKELAAHFRQRGKTVLVGGSFASLAPEEFTGRADILVKGEIEEIAGELFSDLASGKWKAEYIGTKPDLSNAPVPRWDFYRNERARSGALQISRGCPFNCEYCDVISYLGRKQRHKSTEQVEAELNELYRHGYRHIFISDDNFSAHRRKAKETLELMKHWNAHQEFGKCAFFTQMSMDAGADEEFLRLCYEGGLHQGFIGVETVNEASLLEARKKHNLGFDIKGRLQNYVEHGILVVSGMMVGFDHDSLDTFKDLRDFANSMPIPVFTLMSTMAPRTTPLYTRMKAEGRIRSDKDDTADRPWISNIVHKTIEREEFKKHFLWLVKEMYRPESFQNRMKMFIDSYGKRVDLWSYEYEKMPLREIDTKSIFLLKELSKMGQAERDLVDISMRACESKKQVLPHVVGSLINYAQIRLMYRDAIRWDQ